VTHRRSKEAAGFGGRGGRRRGPAAGGGDGGGEGPPGRGERKARVELTVEGGNDSGGGLKYCEGRWWFDHQRGREDEGRRGVLVVRFEGRTTGGKKGRGGIRRRPFKRRGGGIEEGGSGVGVRVEEGEGRRGGLVRRRAAQGGLQRPPVVGHGRHRATWTWEPEGLTDGPQPQCRAAAPADRQA
jgi:hypothetical protein